jgi:hypothetical protein
VTVLNLQVGASTDDAQKTASGAGYSDSSTTLNVDSNTSAALRYTVGARFTNVTIPPLSKITVATPSLNVWLAALDDFNIDIHADDQDDSPTFSSGDAPTDRTPTTASVAWVEDAAGTGFQSPPSDCSAVIQEVIDRGGWASGNDLSLLFIGRSDLNKSALCFSYDNSGASATTTRRRPLRSLTSPTPLRRCDAGPCS